MIKQTKYYYNYMLILIGLTVVSWIIWARFLRTRVPKDIPIHLTEKWYFILLYVCFIYFYMVYKLSRPQKSNELVNLLLEQIYLPLVSFDDFIKKSKYVQPKYLKFVDKIVVFVQSYKLVSKQYKIIKSIYMICYIIPRIFLVTILCLDTFYFNKLAWIYKILLVGLIPLLHRYLKYCIKYIKDDYIKELENKYKVVKLSDKNCILIDWEYNLEMMPHHNKKVSIKEFIAIELEMLAIDDPQIGYIAYPFPQDYVALQYLKDKYNTENANNLTAEDIIKLRMDFKKIIPIIIDLSIFLRSYSEIDNLYLIAKLRYVLIRHIKMIIFSLYGICWAYIIYRSYHMIPYPFVDTLYTLVITLPALEEPFSGDLFIYWDNISDDIFIF